MLTACVSSPAPSTPTQKIEPATVAPATNTPIPTNTIVPTPTRDPSIPEGYIEDASGNYTKTENGITITWDKERNAGYSLMFNDFLWDQRPEVEGTIRDTFEWRVFIDSNIANWNKLTVTHNQSTIKSGTVDWSVIFHNFMADIMIRKGIIKDKPDFNYDQFYKSTGYTIQYTTPEGPQTLSLKDGNVTTVHIRADYDALKANMENNNFTEATGSTNLGSPSIKYMVKISSDKDGNTIVEIAPNINDALQWSDKRIIEMYLFGFSAAFCIPDELLIPRATSFSSDLAMNHASYPYFIFTRLK